MHENFKFLIVRACEVYQILNTPLAPICVNARKSYNILGQNIECRTRNIEFRSGKT